MFFSFGTSSSWALPSGSVICRRILPLVSLPNEHRAGLLGQHADVLGRTGFEEFRHTRQTAGNVAGLLAFDRDTGEHFTRQQFLAVADLDQRADLEADGHRVIGARDLDLVALRRRAA